MALLCVLLRETVERLVGSDDYARRLLDVFDRRHSPDVRLLFSRGVTVGSVVRVEGSERRGAPAAVIQKQHAPTIQEHGLMPGRNGHLTSVANPLGEIDEGHQARDGTHMVIFYLIQGRAGRSHPLLERAFELATAPLTWRACSPACVTRIGPKRASRAANKASNGKPFVYEELVARMRAVLRRASGPPHRCLAVRDLDIDLASRVVRVAGDAVQLSAKEYELRFISP
jgi:hypothetical protein